MSAPTHGETKSERDSHKDRRTVKDKCIVTAAGARYSGITAV